MVIPEIGVSGGFSGSGFTTCGGGGGGCPSNSPSPSSPLNILPPNYLENEQAEPRYVIKEENDTAAECVREPASSSSSMIEPMTIKVEAEEGFEDKVEEQDTAGEIDGGGSGGGLDDGNDNGNSGSPSSCSSVVLPKPMEGLHDAGPPPFLKKTFEMVEDPESDWVVSWSKKRDSFVVWDSHEFSKNLLPRYFKHSNFSSFIRQLNTYGFRKIDPDRWEFANEGFQGGKKHLLKNIKRRNRYNNKQQHGAGSGSDHSTRLEAEVEVESLKNDQDVLRLEISKLRQQQEDSQNQLSAVEDRIRAAECKQMQMLVFFTKAARNPSFIRQLMLKRRQQGELDAAEFRKKRRLLPNQVTETLPDAVDTCQSVNCRSQAQEQFATMQTELTAILSEQAETCQMPKLPKLFSAPLSDELCHPVQYQKASMMCGTGSEEITSVYNLMSEKLLDDSLVVGNSSEELDVDDSKFYLELEDLIARPRGWVDMCPS